MGLGGGGLLPSQVGVITPYNGQLELLRAALLPRWGAAGLEVRTVDGFQVSQAVGQQSISQSTKRSVGQSVGQAVSR